MAQIVTITNPLTGQPAQVDQLDHTAQQIDDGLNIARGVSNPNLLDNWYFGNPVNQRGGKIVPVGITYYSDTSLSTAAGTTTSPFIATAVNSTYGSISVSGTTYYVAASDIVHGYILKANTVAYTFDRWKLSFHGSYIYVKNGCLQFYATAGNNELLQEIDNKLSGETIVLSAIVNNVLYCTNPVTVPTSITGGNSILTSIAIPNVGDFRIYQLASGNIACAIDTKTTTSFTVKAMKLELGDQQTLAHQENGVWVLNEIPDYEEQLARCMRYFQVVTNGTLVGSLYTSQAGRVYYHFPVTMRDNPSIINNPKGLTLWGHSPGNGRHTVDLYTNPNATVDGFDIDFGVNDAGTFVTSGWGVVINTIDINTKNNEPICWVNAEL